MVGKKSGKALLREEGLERTDNNMDLTSWPQVNMINQKNYYTEYLKRDEQILALRLLQEDKTNRMVNNAKDRDRELAQGVPGELPPADVEMDMDEDAGMDDIAAGSEEQDASGNRIIVIHPGSQNLRVGLASDALPKSVPMVIARKWRCNEAEAGDGEPLPKRLKTDDGGLEEPEKLFGQDFANQYSTMSADLKIHMRLNKRRVLPNSKELVVNYNKRTPPETISEHNDPLRIDWTEIPQDPKKAPDFYTGDEALRIPDNSSPSYRLFWPLKHGWYNEDDYNSKTLLYEDIAIIIEEAIKRQLHLERKKDWNQYDCVFVIPDLYERQYVTQVLEMLIREFNFNRVCFIQESLAATFGAGYATTCVIDIGAQKTTICCVEEGMCVDNSRINIKYGGWDITDTFTRMMLFDHFPYADINLKRRYDFLLAEELKKNFCTMNESDISVQLFDFHLRASGQDTRKYAFKTYDEVLLAPQGLFQPSIFDTAYKLQGRRKLIGPSLDLYDGSPNDPVSSAQSAVVQAINPQPRPNGLEAVANGDSIGNGNTASTPSRQLLNPFQRFNEPEHTPSALGSPAPEGDGTPAPPADAIINNTVNTLESSIRDDILPIMPLDAAVLTSITHGARGDERKTRDFLGSIMVIGGGSLIRGLPQFLEDRLKQMRPGSIKDILVSSSPRELDAQGVSWKGASVFGKLRGTNDSWIGQMEYDRLGSRLLAYKSSENTPDGPPASPPWDVGTPSTASSETVTEFTIDRRVDYTAKATAEDTAEASTNPSTNASTEATTEGIMANQAGRQERVIHQDYIVRQRYNNDLPPPPGDPKLLEIPTDMLSYYCSPAFTSRLARQQPLNIEADAFLGMPIDLVGMPGIFDGDESSIQAPLVPPPVHPRDKALLVPMSQRGKPKTETNTVSFLRRTQYTADDAGRTRVESNTSRNLVNQTIKKRKPADVSKDNPVNIMRNIVKGFDIAYPEDAYKGPDTEQNIRGAVPSPAEIEAWKNPKHPTKPHLKLLDSYPILPNLDGLTDSSGYMVTKFAVDPSHATDHHDERMDVGLLHPIDLAPEVSAHLEAQRLAYEADPEHNPPPGPPPYNYEFFLPKDEQTAKAIKKEFDVANPDKKPDSEQEAFRYEHVRVYETGLQSSNATDPYQEVALSLTDSDRNQATAAFYYPILQKMQLKARRNKNLAKLGLASKAAEDEGEKIDAVDLIVRDPNEDEQLRRTSHKAELDHGLQVEDEARSGKVEADADN